MDNTLHWVMREHYPLGLARKPWIEGTIGDEGDDLAGNIHQVTPPAGQQLLHHPQPFVIGGRMQCRVAPLGRTMRQQVCSVRCCEPDGSQGERAQGKVLRTSTPHTLHPTPHTPHPTSHTQTTLCRLSLYQATQANPPYTNPSAPSGPTHLPRGPLRRESWQALKIE